MILLVQLVGALLGLLAVVFGAFGAHALKKSMSPELLQSFETGVRYQMYHALLLLVLGFNLGFTTPLETTIAYCFIGGTVLFSFSIYVLTYLASRGRKIPLLGLVTPIGGMVLVLGWGLLFYLFMENIV